MDALRRKLEENYNQSNLTKLSIDGQEVEGTHYKPKKNFKYED